MNYTEMSAKIESIEFINSPHFLFFVERFKNQLKDTDKILYSFFFTLKTLGQEVVEEDIIFQKNTSPDFLLTTFELSELIVTSKRKVSNSLINLQESGLLKFHKNNNVLNIWLLDPKLSTEEIKIIQARRNMVI